jgi:hypothetical protein
VLCTYTGTDNRYYMNYLDAATGQTLKVSPGGQYDVEVASGQAPGLLLPPGDGRWAVADLPSDSAVEPEPAVPVTSQAGDSPAEEE